MSNFAYGSVSVYFILLVFPVFAHRHIRASESKTKKNVLHIKKLSDLENDDNAVILYQDEVHFQVTTSVTQKWVIKGSKPKVKSAPGRKSVPYSGYVCPKTGELIVNKPTWFNYETVIESFRDLLHDFSVDPGKRIYLVLDNAPWHKKAVRLVQTEKLPEYADIREKITLIFLPPYSPDLNPIEQIWRITRREVTHNTYFPNELVLGDTLDMYVSSYRRPNEKLSHLCSFKYNN